MTLQSLLKALTFGSLLFTVVLPAASAADNCHGDSESWQRDHDATSLLQVQKSVRHGKSVHVETVSAKLGNEQHALDRRAIGATTTPASATVAVAVIMGAPAAGANGATTTTTPAPAKTTTTSPKPHTQPPPLQAPTPPAINETAQEASDEAMTKPTAAPTQTTTPNVVAESIAEAAARAMVEHAAAQLTAFNKEREAAAKVAVWMAAAAAANATSEASRAERNSVVLGLDAVHKTAQAAKAMFMSTPKPIPYRAPPLPPLAQPMLPGAAGTVGQGDLQTFPSLR